ncbi:MAG: hypothetical protein R3A79_13665 [Nannocystaceae bacterium]
MSITMINLNITIDQTNLILEALGQQPFVKVYELIASIQAQAKRQLEGDAQDGPQAPSLLGGVGGE